MHYFWIAGRDHGKSSEAITALETLTKVGFAEDEEMIEAIQATASRLPNGRGAPEVSVKMDTAGIQARRIVQRWMARETA
jgi:vanillate O-demethylase monooxygenase subunit